MSELRELFRQAAGIDGQDDVKFILCEVESVDEKERTCVVTSVSDKTETNLEGVRLMSESGDGWLLVPKVESTVLVCKTLQLQPYVVMFSELDKILMIVGDSSVEITEGLIQFNDGSFGGLVKIEELVESINRVEIKVDDLIQKYNAHTHILTLSSGTGTAAPTVTTETPLGTQTTVEELENDLITHGSSV